jgi:integrase
MQHTQPTGPAFDRVGISVSTSLERGIHPRVVQERFGHSTISITLGMYSHVGPTLHDEAAEAIAELLL